MVVRVIKNAVMRLEATLGGRKGCRGLFRVVDEFGEPIGGVEVSYRVGDSDWIPCGKSRREMTSDVNFTQVSMVFYPIGEPVVWRFQKPGRQAVKITRYTADTSYDARLDTVVLSRTTESLVTASETSS